ncbi:MAG: FIG01964566: Predicted membrane protein, hemolysin III homolog, partial [uncultured Blastococcus sp.]
DHPCRRRPAGADRSRRGRAGSSPGPGGHRRPRGGRAGRPRLDGQRFRGQRLGAPRHPAAHARMAAPVRVLRRRRRRRRPHPARVAAGCEGRLLRRAVLHDHLRAVRHQRAVPPPPLVTPRLEDHEAARPLDDLPVHRRHLHAVRAAGRRPADRLLGARRRLGRRAGRCRAEAHLADRAALGGGAALHRPGLGGGVRADRHPAHRRCHLDGPAGRGRAALHPRRRHLRHQEAESVAGDLRLPRGLPRDDDRGRDLPLHRRLLRRLQQSLRL